MANNSQDLAEIMHSIKRIGRMGVYDVYLALENLSVAELKETVDALKTLLGEAHDHNT